MIPHRRKLASQIAGTGVAAVRVLGEASFDNPSQRRRRLGVDLRDRPRVFVEDRRERVDRGPLLERSLPRSHLVEDRAEGELVRAEIHDRPARLLG